MRKLSKTLLSLLLIAAMLASFVVLPAAAEEPAAEQPTEAVQAAETQADDAVKTNYELSIVMLDCGRKYFSVDSIKQIIDNASAAGFGYIMLGVGNDGMRFLLDDMSLTVGDKAYSSEDVAAAIHAGNEAYYNFAVDELTQSEMDAVLAYAKEKGMGVIPMLNTPGHMDAILAAATSLTGTNCSYNGSVRTIDVTNNMAVTFTQELLKKYVAYFAGKGCKYFNMGADEYANDKYTGGSMGFGNLQSTGNYSYYVKYVNAVAALIKNAGMTPMAFNDGIYFNNNTSSGTFDTDIVICYWSNGWSSYTPMPASNLASKGFKMVNDVKPGGVFMINCQWDFDELNHHLKADAKRYIAKNNIQLYTINAIDLAIKIGMGKRNNTILQSAFFSLAKVMPEEQAIQYMKDAATHSYLKKGQDVVDMNHKAIDLGATAYTKIDVPADWANAVDADEAVSYEGKPELVEQVKNILDPVDKMDGDSLPVSAFMPHVDGQWELGAAAYEKRGVAVSVPTWDETKCIQCNNCAYVCPHATIRPFALTEEEAKNAPANAKIVDIKAGKGKGVYKYTMAISPLDCMGCGVCVGQCPVGALTMVGQESELPEQDVFNYCVSKVSDKKDMQDLTVKGSQFKQPMLEFSGSCAGCAETSYARLVTQLFGDRMYISNATGCSSIWGGPGATSPYCTDKNGHGPAWCNSLFEDNAEHGFGMYVGQEKIREDLMAKTEQLIAIEWTQPALKEAAQKWLNTKDDGNANAEATKEYVAALQANIATVDELAAVPKFAEHAAELKAKGEKFCDCDACKLVAEILDKKDYLSKKSVWIFGGDGWAYDIGFGGVDHVLAQNKNVNVFVFDTEVYSNTGGQASKSTAAGAIAKFAAGGKNTKKKDLGMMAMSYGYVYVAQVAMGADPAQTLKAIREAEAYPGPSLVIAYCPCIEHGMKCGMGLSQLEEKKAVECGYWHLYRYDPRLKQDGKNPFTLDSKEPNGDFQQFLMGQNRYASLKLSFPEKAQELYEKAARDAQERYDGYRRLSEQ